MRNTHKIGDRAEAEILSRLMRRYEAVLIPFGNGQRYDFVADTGVEFVRIQCKAGHIRNGCVEFKAHSRSPHGARTSRGYRGEADFFGVYCAENNKAYLVPVEDVGQTTGSLRIEPPRNNQQLGVRWAKQYEMNLRPLGDNGKHTAMVRRKRRFGSVSGLKG